MQGRQDAAGMFRLSSLLTEGARMCGEDWIFQQDNAVANNIHLLDHPPCLPDLNLIENLRGWMVRND